MKKCPNCSQIYPVAENFCADDGAVLIFERDLDYIPVGQNFSGEVPTQVVSRPSPLVTPNVIIAPNAPPDNSKLLYAVIVGLVAVILAMGAGFLMWREPSQPERAANSQKSASNQKSEDEAKSNQSNKSEKSFAPANVAKPISKPADNKPADNRAPDNKAPASISSRRFQRNYQGTVDNDGIAMYLTRNGSSLNGKVYSRNSSTEITVEGYIDEDGYFEMEEMSDIGVVTGIYRGHLESDNTINGTWSKPNGDKSRPLYLRPQ
jgi:hypothetical protein